MDFLWQLYLSSGSKKYLNSSLSFGQAALTFFLPVSTFHLSYNKLVNDFVRGCLTFRSYLPSKKIDSFRLLDGAFCEPWKTECARCMLEFHMRSNKPPWLLILTGQCRKLNFNIKLTNGPKRIVLYVYYHRGFCQEIMMGSWQYGSG